MKNIVCCHPWPDEACSAQNDQTPFFVCVRTNSYPDNPVLENCKKTSDLFFVMSLINIYLTFQPKEAQMTY